MKPRRVLHVMNGAGGGAAMSTLGLIRALAARGVSSSVACHEMGAPDEQAIIREAVGGGITFLPLYWWNKKLRMKAWKRPLAELRQSWKTGYGMGSAAAVAAFALREQCDLVHTNTILTPEGSRAASLLGLPHVWHVRELLGKDAPFQLPFSDEALGKMLARRASVVVANSAATARPLIGIVPAEQLAVVDNGIDLSSFAPREQSATHAGGGPTVIAMVGNLTSRWKKHALFVEMGAQLTSMARVELRFYGHAEPNDPYVKDLIALAGKLGIADKVQFAGHHAPADIMRDVDILVHPADQESFGRVVVEAMAAAIPVVGVAAGGVAEIVVPGETGLIAPVDDAAGLAAAVDRLLGDPQLAIRLGAAGRARAQRHYSLDACADHMLEVYDRAMRRPLGWISPRERTS